MPPPLRLALPPDLTSPGAARQAVRERFAPELDAGDVELAVLVVSELVTNAVLHAGTPCEVVVQVDDDRLRIEVHDGDTRQPVRRDVPSAGGTGGRGMRMLHALGDQWGSDPGGDGKVVWWERALHA